MSAFGWIVVSGLSMSGIALAGAVIFLLGEDARQRIILPLVAFSAGSLMGGAFLHMIPEAVAMSDGDISMYLWVLAGFSTFLALEQVLHWHHCHSDSPDAKSPLTYLILIGDAFHGFLGGVAVAGAFLVDIGLGVSIWLATAAHELPQELGKYGVLLHGGWDRRRAMIVNTFFSLSFLVGGTLTYAVSLQVDVRFIIPFAAGNFIYIGASDLIPEVNKNHHISTNLVHFSSFLAGVGVLFLVRLALE
jgi:zinc and cadmium transporter